jgi:hypothetical protein
MAKIVCIEKEVSEPTHVERSAQEEAAAKAASAARAARLKRGCSWSYTFTPSEKELRSMSARGTQGISTAISGNITLDITAPIASYGVNPSQAIVSMPGGQCSMYFVAQHPASPAPTDPDMLAAYTTWQGLRNPPAGWSNAIYFVTMWAIRARVPGEFPTSPVEDIKYVCAGWQAYAPPGGKPPYTWVWIGPTELNEDYSIGLGGAYRKAEITQSLPSGQSGLHHPCQRTGTAHYYADASTTTSATIGDCGVSSNYHMVAETQLTMAVTIQIDYRQAAAVDTGYAWVTLNGGLNLTQISLSNLTFYKDTGASDWHWHGAAEDPSLAPPPDANVFWKTVPSGNTITIYREPGGSGGVVSWTEAIGVRTVRVVPRLWKQNKTGGSHTETYQQYSTYDTSQGHPFDIGLYHHLVDGERETDAQVSVAPIFSGYYEYTEVWTAGVAIPEDVWAKFHALGNGFWCNLRADWLTANNENVVFTNPLTTADVPRYDSETEITYPLTDIRVPCTFHDLIAPLADDPWTDDWITWARTELNLDKPDGTNRPSVWFPTSEHVAIYYDTDRWVMDEPDAAVARRLATRRTWRMERFAAHLWTGLPGADKQEVNDEYPLLTRANYDAGLDDPDWWTASNDWEPAASYELGRIDTYEGVECSGSCDQFTQRFFEQKFGVVFPSDWWKGDSGEQSANLPDEVFWHLALEGSPEPGDMLIMDSPWSDVGHAGICHSVDGGLVYIANSNHGDNDGDNLGYFDEVSDIGLTISGWYRYQTGVDYEDVTDWRQLSCIACQFAGATVDIPVSLNLTYKTLSGSNPHYTDAYYKFGAEGEATAEWSSAKTATVEGVLSAATGYVIWDLGPDSGDEPLDLCRVTKVELVFGEACDLTFLGWQTTPYDAAHPVAEVAMRIACKHSSDYFGARQHVDGMPNYKPDYLYTLDSERVEVGFKHTQDLQHSPNYTGDADDMRYIKSLARWYNEQIYGQLLGTPTLSQANIDRDLKDVNGVYLGTPIWGDYDEDGFCLHVGTNLDTFFPVTLIYCDYILQGGTRGISKGNGVRNVGVADAVTLYGSIDNGTTKTAIRSADTGYAGEFRVGSGLEKAPWKYWLDATALGPFVNAEEVYSGTFIPGVGQLHLARHPVSGLLIVTDCSMLANIGQHRIGGVDGWTERAECPATPSMQTACTVTNISQGNLLIYGDGGGSYLKPQTHLMGEWSAAVPLALGQGLSWPVGHNHKGSIAFAGRDSAGAILFFRFDMENGYARNAPSGTTYITGSSQDCAPALCTLEETWRMVAAVARATGVTIFSTNDMGESWAEVANVLGDPLHPAVAYHGSDIYVLAYYAETYLGAQGTAKLHRVDAKATPWVVGDQLAAFPCDEGRPAIYVAPTTYEVIVLTPKVQGWGVAGPSPAIVEYRSPDKGTTWSDPVVHGVA